jgi:hypothetical protein
MATFQNGMMLDAAGNDMIAGSTEGFSHTLKRKIIGLGAARGKNDFFRGGSYESSDNRTGLIQGFLASLPNQCMLEALPNTSVNKVA